MRKVVIHSIEGVGNATQLQVTEEIQPRLDLIGSFGIHVSVVLDGIVVVVAIPNVAWASNSCPDDLSKVSSIVAIGPSTDDPIEFAIGRDVV